MALEIEGKVFQILPEQSGTSQASGKTWRKQNFVIETEEQYPKKIVFNSWNDTVDIIKNMTIGDKIKISFRAESREYNERWYTDLTAWKIVKITEQTITNEPTTNTPPGDIIYENKNTQDNNTDITTNEQEDDLPF